MKILTFEQAEACAREVLDLTLDGWERTIFFDVSKLLEEAGEVAETFNKSSKTKEDFGAEISDLITVALVLCLKSGVELGDVFTDNHKKRIKRLINRYHNGEYPDLSGRYKDL